MYARVYITLKRSVLDPQGEAVRKSLISLGFDETESVRIGKFIELEIDCDDESVAAERVEEMCAKLLANTVIERYEYELMGDHNNAFRRTGISRFKLRS